MVMTSARLTRERLAAAATVVRRGGWKAGLWTTSTEAGDLLVKDLRGSSAVYRWTIGRWALWNEGHVYRKADGCAFMPTFVGWLDSDAFAIERIDAPNLGRFPRTQLTPDFYTQLQDCVAELHRRGIVHLDLRSRRNILVTPDGRPMLIDFGNALCLDRPRWARAAFTWLLGGIDNSAVLKFRHKDFPESLSPLEQLRCRTYCWWRVLWPWGRLWRILGVNRWLKGHSPLHNATRGGNRASRQRSDDMPSGRVQQSRP